MKINNISAYKMSDTIHFNAMSVRVKSFFSCNSFHSDEDYAYTERQTLDATNTDNAAQRSPQQIPAPESTQEAPVIVDMPDDLPPLLPPGAIDSKTDGQFIVFKSPPSKSSKLILNPRDENERVKSARSTKEPKILKYTYGTEVHLMNLKNVSYLPYIELG